jgi:hypothetical protein
MTKGAAALSSAIADVRFTPACPDRRSTSRFERAPKIEPRRGPPVIISPSSELPEYAAGRLSSIVPSNLPCCRRFTSRERPSGSWAVWSMPASTAGAAPPSAFSVAAGVSPVKVASRSTTSDVRSWGVSSRSEVLIRVLPG